MSVLSTSPRKHVAWLFETARYAYSDLPATRIRIGDEWHTQTYEELHARVQQIAAALINAGIERGDRVGLLASNMPQWTQIDLATATIGAALVPLYSTSTAEQIEHICADSGVKILFTGDEQQTRSAQEAAPKLGELQKIISLHDVEGVENLEAFAPHQEPSEDQSEAIRRRMVAASPNDIFSITYTSGTTGDPRGVVISHKAMFTQLEALDQFFDLDTSDHSLCFLPLSHALERGWSAFVMASGCMNTYVPDTRKVAELLVLAQPTMLVSVPKLYETVFKEARRKVSKSKIRKAIFAWALRVGARMQKSFVKGRKPQLWWRAQLPLADKLVLKNVREAMGGRKTLLACGGAPLRIEVEHFFSSCGMPILTGYGLTEAAPLVSFNRPNYHREGSCGPVIPGGEIAIGLNSEIYYRGENLMDGYWNNPKATAEAIDEEGWLHTGDMGYVDEDGFLFITDRLKDIIVTIGGKNVSPAPIEDMLLADPLFEQAVILGNNRPYLTLLVKPSMPALEEISEKLHIAHDDFKQVLENSEVLEEIRKRVEEITEKLPRQEQIRDIRLLPDGFTLENGLLTPSLKIKRREVEERFREVIEDMYTKLAEKKEERNRQEKK